MQIGEVLARDRHLDPLVPIFRAALLEALRRTRGVAEAREAGVERRPVDTLLLRGELADDLGPLVPAATTLARALGGRFELVDPDGHVLQRFSGLQRYAGGPGVAAFSAQGLIDLALLLGAAVAGAVGRWLAGGPVALPASIATAAGAVVLVTS